MKRSRIVLAILMACLPQPAGSADLFAGAATPTPPDTATYVIRGRAAALSGDTLWFPQFAKRVRLAGIDACALPQWAFDPTPQQERAILAPVPCGPFGKAWLKRLIGGRNVACRGAMPSGGFQSYAYCTVSGQDIGLEMLRVGWARIAPDGYGDARYVRAERDARAAEYGLWGTYVLDMAEWRDKAVDRTTGRRPQADRNLLGDRHLEITPPFAAWQARPRRTDR